MGIFPCSMFTAIWDNASICSSVMYWTRVFLWLGGHLYSNFKKAVWRPIRLLVISSNDKIMVRPRLFTPLEHKPRYLLQEKYWYATDKSCPYGVINQPTGSHICIVARSKECLKYLVWPGKICEAKLKACLWSLSFRNRTVYAHS
jgi:hypothetical protein